MLADRIRVSEGQAARGGRYVLSVRRFLADTLPGGARTTGTLGRALARWYRFRADADQTLVLTARATQFGYSIYELQAYPVAGA